MKNNITLLAALQMILGLLIYSGLGAQIQVSNDNNVGVGSVDANSKLNVNNDVRTKSLRIHSLHSGMNLHGIENMLQGDASGIIFGLDNFFTATASQIYGVRNRITQPAGIKQGLNNNITGNSTSEHIYGTYNITNGDFSSTSGLYNNLSGNGNVTYGVNTVMNNDADSKYGISNNMRGNGTDEIISGIYNKVNGEFNTTYGMWNRVFGEGTNMYGAYNQTNTSIANKYGMYNFFTGNGSSEKMYGSYNRLNGDYDTAHGTYNSFTGTGNRAYGILTVIPTTAEIQYTYGVRNQLSGKKNGTYGVVKGLENVVKGNDFNEVYGNANELFTTSDNTTVAATKNFIQVKSNGEVAANRNEIQLKPSVTAGNVYGTYNAFNGSGSPAKICGTYMQYLQSGSTHPAEAIGLEVNISDGPSQIYGVKASAPTGTDKYAGYFTGDVYVNGSPVQGSDKRLKEGINDISSALANIKKLKPSKYKIKRERKNKDRKEHFGFIAQDVQQVFPELVRSVAQPGEIKEVVLSPERKEFGPDGQEVIIPAITEKRQDMDGEPMLAVNYIGLIPQIVSAIQEQDQRIDEVAHNATQVDDKFADKVTYKLDSAEERIAQLEATIQRLLACTDCDEGEIMDGNRFNLKVDQLDMTLYPNPAFDFVNVEIASEASGVLDIKVFDVQGRIVTQEDMMLIEGINVHRMEIDEWTEGTYYVTTTFEGVTNSQKLIVE